MRRGLIAANWKMHGQLDENDALVKGILSSIASKAALEQELKADVLLCPPAVYLGQLEQMLKGTELLLGGQNLFTGEKGAFTGEISGVMLSDIGCQYVIVGHSERRQLFGDTDEIIANKFADAIKAGLIPILCVGESQSERDNGETASVVLQQLRCVIDKCSIEAFRNAVIAYEPVWAIGTGLTASPQQAQSVHELIRNTLDEQSHDIAQSIKILYGGSVKADNAAQLFE